MKVGISEKFNKVVKMAQESVAKLAVDLSLSECKTVMDFHSVGLSCLTIR